MNWVKVIVMKKRRRPKRRRVVSEREAKRYLAYREDARRKIHEILANVNQCYRFDYGRVAIRNQRRSWGSCSQAGNLNFNYKIMFLAERLQEYIVAHELCHLQEFNHGPDFWRLVEEFVPDYKDIRKTLKNIPISSL